MGVGRVASPPHPAALRRVEHHGQPQVPLAQRLVTITSAAQLSGGAFAVPEALIAASAFPLDDGQGRHTPQARPQAHGRRNLHSDWKVGETVSVEGRLGVVFWDGRPKHEYAMLRWQDDDSESGV